MCAMHAMIEITLDGYTLSVAPGTTLMQAADACGVAIPRLCHHEGLPPMGNCRVCVVEIEQKGRSRLVASCMYPVTAPVDVKTASERVLAARRFVIGLLVNRNPKAPVIQKLAREYGVEPEERFAHERDLCIRCSRCVRACEANGTNAIELARTGFDRFVSAPYDEPASDCIGCLSCAEVCPTGKITYTDSESGRAIWGRQFELVACARCGRRFATPEQLAWAKTPAEEARTCEHCRRAIYSATLGTLERGL